MSTNPEACDVNDMKMTATRTRPWLLILAYIQWDLQSLLHLLGYLGVLITLFQSTHPCQAFTSRFSALLAQVTGHVSEHDTETANISTDFRLNASIGFNFISIFIQNSQQLAVLGSSDEFFHDDIEQSVHLSTAPRYVFYYVWGSFSHSLFYCCPFLTR